MDFDMQRSSRIVWPESLLKGIEYWLSVTTMKNSSPPVFKLPTILASSDNQTWLATRKSQKQQKEVFSYSEWLTPKKQDEISSENSRVPSLAQHTFTLNSQKQSHTDDQPMTDVKVSRKSSYNDIWQRSNSAVAVHEYSNFKFMYNNMNDDTSKWLAKSSQQKWSPKRQKLENPINISWTADGSASLFVSSTASTFSSATSTGSKSTATLPMDTARADPIQNVILSSWLNTATTSAIKTQTNPKQEFYFENATIKDKQVDPTGEAQKKLDIIGWINTVKPEENEIIHDKQSNTDITEAETDNDDCWLLKSSDKMSDPVDAVRNGFKTLQVADSNIPKQTTIQNSPQSSKLLLEWLSTSSTTRQTPDLSPIHAALRDRLAPEKHSVSSDTTEDKSWILCSETSVASSSSRSSSCEDIIMM